VEFNTIFTIHEYKRLPEGHYFMLMAMEVHNASKRDMDRYIRECAHLFHDRQSRGHLSLSFCIQCVYIDLQHALASIIERKIKLEGDVCPKLPITIRFHNLHVGNIKGAMGEIASYHERD
jgi:hypothetical protein